MKLPLLFNKCAVPGILNIRNVSTSTIICSTQWDQLDKRYGNFIGMLVVKGEENRSRRQALRLIQLTLPHDRYMWLFGFCEPEES